MKKVYMAILTLALVGVGALNLKAQTYCASGATSTIDTYISNVTVGSVINQTNTSCATYTDNTSAPGTLNPGYNYNVSVTSGDCNGGGVYNHGMEVYIDWNADGDFTDPGENVHSKGNSAASTESFVIVPPVSAAGTTVRMRAIVTEGGVSGPCGSYSWGETEDYALDIVIPPGVNASLTSVSALPSGFTAPAGYTEIPLNQVASITFGATALSSFTGTISGTKLFADVLGNAFLDSALVDTLISLQDSTVTFAPFNVTGTGNYEMKAHVTMDQLDTVSTDDTMSLSFSITDTIFARDDTSVTGGLGVTGATAQFGHLFELQVPDTMTTVSFYLNSPTVGAQTRVMIYKQDTTQTNGFQVGTTGNYFELVDSSRVYSINSTNAGWVTLPIGCDGAILGAGVYMVALDQVNPNNMGLGFTYDLVADAGVTYFIISNDTVWEDLFTSTSSVNRAIFKIRANFGTPWSPNVLADSNISCFGTPTVVKTLQAFDQYLWSNSTLFDSVTVNNPGIMSVTITDEIGCSYEDSTQVSQYPQIGLNVSSNPSSCGGKDGDATALAAGIFPAYSYEWSDGTTGGTISNIAGGTYDVTVTDGVGCSRTESVTILGALPTIAGSFSYPTCAGDADGAAEVSVVSGVPSFSYNWGSGGTGDTEAGLSAGSYSVTVTDSSGCSASINVDVLDPDTLNLSTANSNDPTSCGANDGIANAGVTGGVAPYTYFWSNGQNQANNINLSTGTYDVTVTDANGCVRTSTVSLVDPDAQTLTAVSSSVTCSYDLGDVAVSVAGGTAPFVYAWSNGSTDSSQTSVPVGVYNVVVTDASGCVRLTTVDVDGPDPLSIAFSENNVTGQGKADLVAIPTGATPNYTLLEWLLDQGSTNMVVAGENDTVYTNAPNGLYWFRVTDSDGCVDSAQYNLQVPTGIVWMNQEEGISLFPNPAKDVLTLSLDFDSSELTLEIYSINGALITSSEYSSQSARDIKLDVSELANGMYVLGVKNQNKTIFKKFQISK